MEERLRNREYPASRLGINVPRNDYKRPIEVRRELVQQICDYIVGWMNREDRWHPWLAGSYELELKGNDGFLSLYFVTKESNGEYIGFSWGDDRESGKCFTKIRSAEMKAAFNAIQDAGYNIFENGYSYMFTKKPIWLGKKAERITFDAFID